MSTEPTPPSGHNTLAGDLFDKEAAYYDRLRPGYPEQLFDILAAETHLHPSSRLLEIGPGTGQATIPMAKRGYSLTAVEPGPQLADIARRNLAPFPNANVVVGKFEDVELAEGSFDLIYGATSLHWVNQETLFKKMARLLKPGGHVAIIYNDLVELPEDKAYFDAFEPIVLRYGVTSVLRSGMAPRTVQAVSPLVKHMEDLGPKLTVDTNLFDEIGFFVTDPPLAFEYQNMEDYLNYLRTISHVSQLPELDREGFLAEVRNLIETKFGNRVTLHFSATLQLARKKTS
ncbi:MAG: class I SAM-dependent methyltransferase [Candidatus Saccharimonadales bacterium]|jgi:SAM-dependent methyltransferase